MAFQWSTVGLGNTYNLGPYTSGAQVMWALIDVMLAAGWTKVFDSDGSSYSAVGAQLTHGSSGANGLDNNSAWARLQDPGGNREVIIQRSSNDYTWRTLYSASDKFVGGFPNATTPSTATDQQGFTYGQSTSFAQVFEASDLFICHATAETTPTNGVYPVWMLARGIPVGSYGGYGCAFIMDGLTQISSSDADPCVMGFGWGDLKTNNHWEIDGGSGTSALSGWMRYGEVNEEWGSLAMLPWYGGAMFIDNFGCNPHDGAFYLGRDLVGRSVADGSIRGPKGRMASFGYRVATHLKYPNVVEDGSGDLWLIADHVAFRGWPAGVKPRV